MIKAVLFDMDGVLIDAREWHFDALNSALEYFGHSIDRASHLSTFDGLTTKQKLDILSMTEDLPRPLHELINQLKQAITIEISYSRCRPTFNHQLTLSYLKEKGLAIAVCSNSIRATVETLMRLSKLDRYLDLILSNEDVVSPKPDPEIYVRAMNTFGLSPSECLIVEDNDHGVRAAEASGGWLLKVRSPADVTAELISNRIQEIEVNC